MSVDGWRRRGPEQLSRDYEVTGPGFQYRGTEFLDPRVASDLRNVNPDLVDAIKARGSYRARTPEEVPTLGDAAEFTRRWGLEIALVQHPSGKIIVNVGGPDSVRVGAGEVIWHTHPNGTPHSPADVVTLSRRGQKMPSYVIPVDGPGRRDTIYVYDGTGQVPLGYRWGR